MKNPNENRSKGYVVEKFIKDGKKKYRSRSILESFLQHQSSLRGYISRFVRRSHDIDDIVQEAFLRAYRTEQTRDIEHHKSFLFKIAHNVAITELTRKSSQIIDYIEDIDNSGVIWGENTVEEEAIAKQSLGIHCKAVAKLPEQCRRVYLMRKVHGMTYKEISEALNIAVSTVEKHMAKGVRLSAKYVEELELGTEKVQNKDQVIKFKGGEI